MSNVAVNTINSLNPPNPQSSIQEERAKNAFDPVKMNYFLEGSQQRSEQAKAMIQQMERDPVLSASPKYFDLTKDQQRALTVEKINRLSQYLEVESPEEFQRRLSYVAVFDPQVNTRLNINLGLFLNCIRGNGTVDQYDFWANKKETGYIKGIYGCFGMTELAHGSNVAGLETTATFDEKTDEFIINTPHIGATKWWIGGAAHSSTHCTVYARLIVKGKDYGVKTFVVPLRDSKHNTCPGVTVGDIGAKMGRDGIDNGWIQFSSVRIPRYFMLQKYAKVSREGNVKLPPLEQLSYSALLGGRVSMALDSFRMSARIITIALRYAIARRQFKSSNGTDNLETQLLNYPLHQRRLLPLLATAYILSAGALKIEKVITDTIAELDAAVAAQDMSKIMQSINSMKSLFVDSGSLKSTSTWLTADLIDQSRQACGGHGYSSYNGFGRAYNDWVVQCTWEGDNNVLAMSVGKPIIRDVVKNVEKGEEITGTLSWLSNSKSSLGDAPILKTLDDLKDNKKILHAIEVVIIRSAYQAHKTIQENGGQFDVVGAEMVTLSKLRAHHYLIEEFLHRLDTIENKELLPYLQSIVQLYSASVVLDKFSGDFLAYGVLPTTLLSGLTSKHIPSLLKAVRPHVVALTDSFQYPDMIINSAIGNYDGNVYENYFKVVKESNPPYISKAPYSADLEAMLNRPALAERERFEKTPEVAKILFK